MTSNVRLPLRNRPGPQRPRINADENATGKHIRQASSITTAPISRPSGSLNNIQTLKANAAQRAALGEVTTTAVNRKALASKLAGKGKETADAVLKRTRSSSVATQRVPLVPTGKLTTTLTQPLQSNAPQIQRPGLSIRATQKIPVHQDVIPVNEIENEQPQVESDDMDVEQVVNVAAPQLEDDSLLIHEQEIEDMVALEEENDFVDQENIAEEPMREKPVRVWPEVDTAKANKFQRELDGIREVFNDEIDDEDTTMVSEYANEIFEYMNELEEECMPNPDYISGQTEITWAMRQTLVDWLLQVHLRYHMLPETLWIAINVVDRFLSKRVVSVVKLQLVGVTAMFIAAKYEEILAPSVDEFVFMTERGYSKEEILKGERIMLQTLDFQISNYCSPYSWMRRISKADDYDIQTRTLSKFLTEVTLLDHRFLRVKPSMVAAIGMYTARRMLGGDWNEAFVYHSGFTEEHLIPGHQMLVQKLLEENFTKQYVCRKYANKKFLKASLFATEWAQNHYEEECNANGMVLAD